MRISSITPVPSSVGIGRRRAAPRQPCTGQVELLDEPVGERRRATGGPGAPGSSERLHLDPGARAAGRRRGGRRTTRRPTALGAGQHLDDEPRTAGRPRRAREQRVRADRHEQQRLDVGPDDRTAGRERVGGGPGGRGHDDAVTPPRRQRTAVDLDGELEHPLARGLLDGHLVQGPATRTPVRRPRRRCTSSVMRSSTV